MYSRESLALRELATLIDAGMPVAEAYEKSFLIALPTAAEGLVQLKRGKPLSQALRKVGLLSPAQRALLAASETSGQLGKALCWLADNHEQHLFRLRTLRSQLLLSIFILFMGAMLSSLVVAAGQSGSVLAVMFSNAARALPVFLLIGVIHHLGNQDAWWWLGKYWPWRDSNLGRRIFAVSWLRLLAWQLNAGLDTAQALGTLRPLVNHAGCQQATAAAMHQVSNGSSLTQALNDQGLLFDPAVRSALDSGEQSGRLSESLLSRVQLQQQQLDDFLDELFVWLSRGLYVLAAVTALSMML